MISRRKFVATSMLASAAALSLGAPLSASATIPTAAKSGLRFGANYVPRKNWWYCWLDWDQQAVVEDLAAIASLGLDHIRIQCLWPFFQPGITNINERALANLHALLDAAAGAGLDVEVTVLNGWMSGLSFMPAWVAPLRNPTDPNVGNRCLPRFIQQQPSIEGGTAFVAIDNSRDIGDGPRTLLLGGVHADPLRVVPPQPRRRPARRERCHDGHMVPLGRAKGRVVERPIPTVGSRLQVPPHHEEPCHRHVSSLQGREPTIDLLRRLARLDPNLRSKLRHGRCRRAPASKRQGSNQYEQPNLRAQLSTSWR